METAHAALAQTAAPDSSSESGLPPNNGEGLGHSRAAARASATVLEGRGAALMREAGEGARVNALGELHIYKATARETGGLVSIWESVVPPGAGAAPHLHTHEDEAFYVLEGEVIIDAEGLEEPTRFGRGSFFYGPRGKRHAFHNPGPHEARLLVLCVPSRGLDSMFAEFEALTEQFGGAPPLRQVARVAATYGVKVMRSALEDAAPL